MLPIRPNGERPALHVIGANAELGEDDVAFDAIANAGHLHFGGTYLLPQFDNPPTGRILELARSRGIPVTLDVLAIDRPDLLQVIEPSLPHIDYFMPGLHEARMICGLQDRRDVIRFLLDWGVRHTVVKMGADGSSIAWLDSDGGIAEVRVPAHAVPVVDSTGRGDAYCAGFIVGLLRGWELLECARFGTAAAGLVIQGLGSDAGIVDFDHTLHFMRSADVLPLSNDEQH